MLKTNLETVYTKFPILKEKKNDLAFSLSGGQQQIFDSPFDDEERVKSTGTIKPAAEFFIANEFGIPYFYGMTRLAYLASYNVEQFLELAGSLFDEIVSKYILKEQPLKILLGMFQVHLLQ